MNEPKLMFYSDPQQRHPLTELNFGELDADESGVRTFYAINFGEKDLKKIVAVCEDPNVTILEHPIEMPVGQLSTFRIRWSPINGENLLSPLLIKGKYNKVVNRP